MAESPPSPAAYVVDNTRNASPIVEGTPVSVFLDDRYEHWPRVDPAGGNLRVGPADGGTEYPTWVQKVSKSGHHGRVWFPSPAVAAHAVLDVQVRCLAEGTPAMAAGYDDTLTDDTPGADTDAAFLMTEGSGTTVASAVGVYQIDLVNAPEWSTNGPGTFRVNDDPPARFANGRRYLTFDGSSQYGTINDLWNTPPDAGLIRWRQKITVNLPPDGITRSTVFKKPGAFEVYWDFGSGKREFCWAVITGGVTHTLRFDFLSMQAGPWNLWTVSYGDSGMAIYANGIVHARNAHTGIPDASSDPMSVCADETPDKFFPVALAEVFFEHVEATRSVELRHFTPGAPSLSDAAYAGWQPGGTGGSAIVVTPDATEANTTNIAEPCVIDLDPALGYGHRYGLAYSGGIFDAGIYFATSDDKDFQDNKHGLIIGRGADGLGNGAGYNGYASRSWFFPDPDNPPRRFISFGDAVTEGANLRLTETLDCGVTWSVPVVILEPDDVHLGWANHSIFKWNGLWWMPAEYRATGGVWLTTLLQAPDPYGPWVEVANAIQATAQQGIGNLSIGFMRWDEGMQMFQIAFHGGLMANLPSAIYLALAKVPQIWELIYNGDPVLDLGLVPAGTLLPGGSQVPDQIADPNPHYAAALGKIRIWGDWTGNQGGASAAAIAMYEQDGGWEKLTEQITWVRPVGSVPADFNFDVLYRGDAVNAKVGGGDAAADGDPIATLADQSGHGNDALVAGGGGTGVLLDLAQFNGRAAFLCDGTAFVLLTEPLVYDGDFTLAVVLKTLGNGDGLFGGDVSNPDAVHVLANVIEFEDGVGGGSSDEISPHITSLTALVIVRSGSTLTFYQDGTARGTGTSSETITYDRIFAITEDVYQLTGQVAMIAARGSAFSPAERDAIFASCRSIWGTP